MTQPVYSAARNSHSLGSYRTKVAESLVNQVCRADYVLAFRPWQRSASTPRESSVQSAVSSCQGSGKRETNECPVESQDLRLQSGRANLSHRTMEDSSDLCMRTSTRSTLLGLPQPWRAPKGIET